MTKISLKKSVLLFSLAALGTYGALVACADYFWGYDYDSSFTPETYVDGSYSPLFFSPQEVFYRIGFETGHVSRFNNTITKDWSEYLKGKLKEEEVSFFMLNDSATTTITQLFNAIQKKQTIPAQYSHLSVNDPKVKGFIEFMYYAKAIEKSTTASPDSWDYDQKELPRVDPKIIAQVEKLFTETRDPFLKNRYWFQTMKGYFYSKNKQSVISFFEKTKATVPVNTLYYRAVSYVAGAHYTNKNYASSNYLYSLVFDKCPELRTVAAYNFHPQEQSDFEASLAMAKTPEEKSALWALLGFYADEKRAIEEIYKLNPMCPHLSYLLTRMVNKEEVRLSAIGVDSVDEYRATIKKSHNNDVLQLVTKIAGEGKTEKPYLWNIAAGYLNIFAGNNALATEFFTKAEKQDQKTALSANQIRLLRLINTLSATSRIDEQIENKLLSELDWLFHARFTGAGEVFRYQKALEWSKRYVSALYKSQQKKVMAELFHRDVNFYREDSQLETMKAFLTKPVKSPWEKMALGIYDVSLSDIFEYQAVMQAYVGNLDGAISFMEQSGSKGVELLGNPFNGKIKDCHDCDHQAAQKIKYTKLSFLKKMKEMETNIQGGVDVYNNSLLLANAYYNMTYYGNARVFYYGNIMDKDGSESDPYYAALLFGCSTARQYYEKAFDAATNDEQRAKCTYMLAKCERNEYYNENPSPEADFLEWEGFKKLKTDYSNTRYYQDVIKECGYFKKYLGLP